MLKASLSNIRGASIPVTKGSTVLPYIFAYLTGLPLHLREGAASAAPPAPRL
jgi:hypothetical protein